MGYRIYGITYSDQHLTEYINYPNHATEKTWRFEYNPMIDIVDNRIADMDDEDYLGIVSWKFRKKTGLSAYTLNSWLSNAAQDAEVYNCCPNLGQNIGGCGNFMDWSVAGHGDMLRELIKACCAHTGLIYNNNPTVVIFANQFLAKKRVYADYINNIVKPSIYLLENVLWEQTNQPAGYTAGVALEKLKLLTGLDFYNYLPFVLERMFMQYIHHRNLKTTNVLC